VGPLKLRVVEIGQSHGTNAIEDEKRAPKLES